MSDRSPRDDDELEALLSELESTLRDLRSELDDRPDGRGRGRRRSDRRASGRRELPRPPSVGELLRFTNDYTIPTVIATLQATIEALELFRRFLELGVGTDRDRGRVGDDDRSILRPALSGAGDRAASDVTDALSRLRTTLAEADLPEDETSRDVIEDARDLSARIEERIADSRETVSRERDRERAENADGDGAVVIDVTDGDDRTGDADGADADAGEPEDDPPQVDVESELRSIKRRMGKGESSADEDPAADEGNDAAGAADDGDEGDTDDENGADADADATTDPDDSPTE
ncbi:DUF7547 family protein [Halorarum halobium]|uniref:DUF7547 family protein n=1 Tax=Halorarum halobium TaxID=3075121 RepID=UPI0028AD1967|nr:hypothetical protein [Halobaculum sp. XH14]